MSRRVVTVVTGAVGAVVVTVVGGWFFQPWKLVVDDRVDEAPPVVAAPEALEAPEVPEAVATVSGATPPAAPPGQEPTAAPAVLSRGTFVSHEHETTGTVEVLGATDGSRVLRISDLDTSNGPVLRVWLTDAPVLPGRDGWSVFDDGPYVDLGALKGNVGSQNCAVPDEVDLDLLTSVSICATGSTSPSARPRWGCGRVAATPGWDDPARERTPLRPSAGRWSPCPRARSSSTNG